MLLLQNDNDIHNDTAPWHHPQHWTTLTPPMLSITLPLPMVLNIVNGIGNVNHTNDTINGNNGH